MVLNLLPIAVLVLAAFVLLILHRFKPSLGGLWVTALLGSVIALALVLVSRWLPFPFLTIQGWLQSGEESFLLSFGFDDVAWSFAFCCLVILMAVILTAPTRLSENDDLREWALSLFIVAAALPPVMSQNPLSLIFTWTALDLIEFLFHLVIAKEERISRQAIVAFAARLAGTFMLYWAYLFSKFEVGSPVDFSEIPANLGLLFLLSTGLRLGVFPVLVPFSKEIVLRREFGTLLRFVVPASSLTLLSRLTALTMPAGWAILLSILALAAASYGVLRFLISSDELAGRPFWMIAVAGMAVVSVVRAQGEAALVWSQALLLMGAFLSLHSLRLKRYFWLMTLGFFGISGLPFSPASSGWFGLIVLPFNFLDILFLVVHAGLLAGFFKHAYREEAPDSGKEPWMLVLYPMGFLLLIFTQWFLQIQTLTASLRAGIWWAGIFSTLAALSAIFLLNRFRPQGMAIDMESSPTASKLLTMGWAFSVVQSTYLGVQRVVESISLILEGDGGILWSFLFLLLMITVLGAR